MHESLIADLAIVLVVAALTGLLSRRLGQPSVLGYLLAGLIVGPYIPIPLFADPHRMEELAEVGVILVMFAVGLEFRVQRLLTILPTSGLAAFVQIGALALAGYATGSMLGWSTAACVTLGSALAISSTMVVSAVLSTNPVEDDVRSHVFGILVVQDVVAILLIAVVTGLSAGQSLEPLALTTMVAQLAATVIGMLLIGVLVLPRLIRVALAQAGTEAVVVLAAGSAFGFALAADLLGYSVALGAFIAGIAVAESGRGTEVEHAVEPLRAVFSAIFFVSIGMTVDPRVAVTTLPLAGLLCVIVILGQLASVTLASLLSGSSLRRSVYSGLALGQIGELSFILATIAISGGSAPAELLPALVTVATLTVFTTPLLLSRADRLISTLDRWMPDRLNRALIAYQAFVRRVRAPGDGPSIRQPATAVLLDWLALIVLFVAYRSLSTHVDSPLLLEAGALVVALPFLYGLVRSGRRLATAIRAASRADRQPTATTRVVEALALAAIAVAVLTPTAAVLRPFLLGSWVEIGLGATLCIASVGVALRIGTLDASYTSGVAQLAMGVARSIESEPTPAKQGSGPLAGLDYVPLTVAADGAAAGSSLADLNLRCRTGATVIAISRGEETRLLPTGHDALAANDVLAVSGSVAAVERARAMLGSTSVSEGGGTGFDRPAGPAA